MAVFDPTDPCHQTPQQRLDEVAAILAAGVLRLRCRSALLAENSAVPAHPESSQNGLDECGETRLHGHRG